MYLTSSIYDTPVSLARLSLTISYKHDRPVDISTRCARFKYFHLITEEGIVTWWCKAFVPIRKYKFRFSHRLKPTVQHLETAETNCKCHPSAQYSNIYAKKCFQKAFQIGLGITFASAEGLRNVTRLIISSI